MVKPKKRKPKTIRTIILLQTAAIGDTVLMSGSVADIRREHPQAKIIICCGKQNRQAALLIPNVDEVVELNIFNVMGSLRTIRGLKPDVIIDFGPWPRINALLCLLSGAYSAGFQTPRQHRHYAYDVTTLHRSDCHEIENQRELVRAIGVKPESEPALEVDPDISVSHPSKPYVVFHMWASGSGKALKEWPDYYWRELLVWCVKHKRHVVLTGGAEDKVATQNFLKSFDEKLSKSITNVAGGLSLSKTYLLLQHAEAAVSVNTGILHMASIAKCPVIGLHGPTSITRWGPLGEGNIALSPIRGFQQYLDLGFEYHRRVPNCMQYIRPAAVAHHLQAFQNKA